MPNLIEQYEAIGRITRNEYGCWLWQGALTGKGYGSLSSGRYAHRVSYEEFKGPIPQGYQVLHTCDRKNCCNPDHLYAGTHADNVADAIARGRYSHSNSFKTHCPKGHEYTEENTYHHKGRRHCKACWKLR